jgi:hypothetical protein
MARWIEATPAQRFHQYALPHAKKQLRGLLENREAFRRSLRPALDAHKKDLASTKLRRRAKAAIAEWKRYNEEIRICRNIIAKA